MNIPNLRYKLKRWLVRYKQRSEEKSQKMALRGMSIEQIKVLNLVKDLASKNPSAIKFDPYSLEIIIALSNILIVLKNDTIHISDINGFLSIIFRSDAYEMLINFIKKEAHRERRKLKYKSKEKIYELIEKISQGNAKD